ncbi:hypothetical protein GCM10010330_49570 [Streptomyces tendae]|nr:hypothetical protein GCM10010330_49570 [Streptomyces tendae]
MLVEPLLDALLDGDEPVAELRVRGRADDTDADHGERSARDALDDPDTAAGQPRVDPQYAHTRPPLVDHLFVQAIGCH